MIKRFLALFFCIASITGLWANTDFREGCIISHSNDTTWGFIHYQGLFQEPKVCLFRKEETGKTHAYFPRDIKAFRFKDSRYFQCMEVPNSSPKDSIFMEYLIQGKVSLYSFFENGGLRYFASGDDGALVELKDEQKVIYINGKKYLRNTRKYVGILRALFSESPSILERMESVELSQKALVKIAHDYHTEVCDGEACIIYEKSLIPRNNRFQYGPLVGVNAYRLFSSEKPEETLNAWQYYDFGTTVFPSFGFFIKKNLPGIHDRFFIQYEGLYFRDELFGNNTMFDLFHYKDIEYMRYRRSLFQNALLFKREYDFGKVDLSWHLGGYLDYTFQSNFEHLEQKRDLNGALVGGLKVLDKDNPFAKRELGYIAGVGASLPIFTNCDLFADLRYQEGFGLNIVTPDYTKRRYLSLIFGLAFGK